MKARVFIGSSTAALQIAEHAQAELSSVCLPDLWTNGKFPPHMTPIESLFVALSEYDFALFVANPEDTSIKRGKDHTTMRDNVLFEMGLFLGRLGRERVFMIAPEQTSEVELSLPSDLTGVQPTRFDPSATNVQASVATALHQMKASLRRFDSPSQRTVFDSSANLQPYQLLFKGGQKWDTSGSHPISDFARGTALLLNEYIELARDNIEGTYEIEIRPNGQGEPSIPRVPGTDRIFEVGFEAKVESTPHGIHIVILNNSDYKWIDSKGITVSTQEWSTFRAPLRAPPGTDLLVRLDDQIDSLPSGKLFLRNLMVKQFSL